MKPLVIALVGQTASGKNRLAVETLEGLPVEIVSLDSMKVFRGMDVGTAKPTPAMRERVPHHLIDVADPHEAFDVARYFRLAEAACVQIRNRGNVPVFVGGTGLYLQIICHGHFRGPGADPTVRAQLHEQARTQGAPSLHARLHRIDPIAAARIHPNDAKRLVRALEVWELTGRPISEQQQEFGHLRNDIDLRLFGLRWPREALNARINQRCDAMFGEGWVAEIQRIREGQGFGPQAGEALGYREILRALDEGSDPTAMAPEIATRTRQFARRQMTWFKRFPLTWFDGTDPADVPELVAAFRAAVQALLETK